MYKIVLFFLLALLFASACSDDRDEDYGPSVKETGDQDTSAPSGETLGKDCSEDAEMCGEDAPFCVIEYASFIDGVDQVEYCTVEDCTVGDSSTCPAPSECIDISQYTGGMEGYPETACFLKGSDTFE